MSDELKPCPFCGFERPHFMEEGHWIYMACESCGCGGPVSTQMRDPSDNWNTRPLEDALRAELAAKDAEIARLNNLLADAISTAREGVVELLDALHADEITQQEVIDSFRQYLLGNAETRICSYCGLLMSGDKAQQMTSHVMQCASNPLVQEIARLREVIQRAEYPHLSMDALRPHCGICERREGEGHQKSCPFHHWRFPEHE